MNTTTTTNEAAAAFLAKLGKLGVTMEASSPLPGVDPAEKKGERGWAHIRYTVTLARNGKAFWSGPYKLGTGHVKWPSEPELMVGKYLRPFMGKDEALRAVWAKRGNRRLIAEDEAKAAAGLAYVQKVAPTLDSVLGSLLSDGSCHFDGERFEDWCSNYGYSDDSIKAKDIFDTCEAIGKDLRRAFSLAEIEELRELSRDL